MTAGVGNARPPRSDSSPSSPTSAVTIRTVADHVQLVVQIVLTTSSKTVSLRISLPAPRAAQARSGSAASSA